jgi:hypothetical protein
MNSLTELNGYVNTLTLPYTDARAAEVYFNTATAANQTQIIDEGFPLTASLGIDITEVANADLSLPTYTINVSNLAGATVTFPTVPDTTVTNPSTGVFRISGISSKSIWDAVKYATINMPATFNGIFTYTSTIAYYSAAYGNQTRAWTTTVTVNDVVFFTTPLEFFYNENAVQAIANTPQIINVDSLYPGVAWQVIITPSSTASIDTFTSTGSGASFSVNNSTKVVTIGGTRAGVNSVLAGLRLDSNANQIDFSLTYTLSNTLNSATDVAVQLMKSYGLQYLSNPQTFYFTEDTSTLIINTPLITDASRDGSGTYTLIITPSTASAVSTLSTTGTGGTSSFNNSTKVLTLTGTRSQVNDRLATLTLLPATDWATDFALTYDLTNPVSINAIKGQVMLCGSNDTEVSNMNLARSYIANRQNILFTSNIPSISDFENDPTDNYTIAFTSALGIFGFVGEVPVSTLTFTGTRTQCNSKFADVRFWPTANSFANGTFTYTQLKNSVQQVSQSVSITGTSAPYNRTRSFLFKSSQLWTPDFEDVRYANWEVALVGGGGAGGGNEIAPSAGGGGGGGQVVVQQNVAVTYQQYSVTVGGGGPGFTTYPTGSFAADGGNTSIFGLTAFGGYGGESGDSGQRAAPGGSSGSGNAGGVGLTGLGPASVTAHAGGGGAGQATVGGNASSRTVPPGNVYDGGIGSKGVYIEWEQTATSMYGWYGGGGSGGSSLVVSGYSQRSSSGSIGNLVDFANAGFTQTSGLTTSAGTGAISNTAIPPTSAPANSGGGGGGQGVNSIPGFYWATTAGGSGVIGIRLTSK